MGGKSRDSEKRRSSVSVLGEEYHENFYDSFDIGRKLGSGQFGTTYECVEKSSGLHFAAKVIPKSKLLTKDDVEDVRREVAILYHVAEQPNIVNMKAAYEDSSNVFIVMELCTGGELYDTILDRIQRLGVPYSERDAAHVAKVIVKVVEICHSLGVIHRDLKPENFLLSSKGSDSELKATDFGLSAFFKPGEGLARHCGSPMYMAPEVVRWRPGAWSANKKPPLYGPEADIWSAGVIIYALLSGFPPFYHSSHSSIEIFKAVLRAQPSFSIPPWPSISDEAKDLVRSMLNPDPAKRPTAHQVLCHPWINEPGVAPEEPLPPVVVDRMKQFSSMVKMKKVAMQVIAAGLKEEEIAGLRELFIMMDVDGSGTITTDELQAGLKNLGAIIPEHEIKRLMAEADIDKSGVIEYGEFLAATMHLSKIEKKENVLKAFQFFDADGSGMISLEELQAACEQLNMSKEEIEGMLEEVDSNHDGNIDYAEFVAMMRSKDPMGATEQASEEDGGGLGALAGMMLANMNKTKEAEKS
eukprot:TRINITY_DN299_c0_g1_i1.p1 TRINITY_DN299_c0_g1~~TRINITY_DN299_c0_g1_i1.p1  ORF type:complete len:526 (+),score=132.98 TRINITY_DN299_c0_g1_i1:135-1712(+)